MREIKFRGWNGIIMLYSEDYDFVELQTEYNDLCFMDEGHDYNERSNLISPLMQYTGLKDKNGKEIYEGDIVKINTRNEDNKRVYETAIVEFRAPHFVYDLSHHKKWYTWHEMQRDSEEIIGNIYENPELLEPK